MRVNFKIIAGLFVAVALLAAGAAYLFRPVTLRIAVGPVGASEVRVVVAYLQALQRERASVRFRLVLTEGAAESARAVDEGKADLAIVRSDIAIPAKTSTVAIVRRDAIMLTARPGSDIRQFGDLRGKTVAMLRGPRENMRILDRILQQYNVRPNEVQRVTASRASVMTALQEGKVDAYFSIAPLVERGPRLALQAIPRGENEAPVLVAVSEAEVFSTENPAYDAVEIARGTFGANPPIPDQALTTLAVTYRLVADNDLSESQIGELTRQLVTLRPQIATEVTAANLLELPSTEDRTGRLPTHPGTAAYVDGELKTFFERYGDYIYLGIMAFSLLGSVVAALFSAFAGRKPESSAPDHLMRSLVERMDEARSAADLATLQTIEHDANALISELLRVATADGGDTARVAAVALLVSEFRHLVTHRAGQLAALTAALAPLRLAPKEGQG
jgi:TRAP transporter TAXI family solute receptor